MFKSRSTTSCNQNTYFWDSINYATKQAKLSLTSKGLKKIFITAPLRDSEQYNWYHMQRYHIKRGSQGFVVAEPRTTLSLMGRTRPSVRDFAALK